jgi:hypothetical protein
MTETQAAITSGEAAGSTANNFHQCLQPISQTRHQVLTDPTFLQKFEKMKGLCGAERKAERRKKRDRKAAKLIVEIC